MTQPHPRLAVVVLCAAGIVVALMQTIIVPLIPSLPTLIHTSDNNSSWALTITLLVGAVGTPIAGRLGDMFGKRRVLIGNMLAVTLGSVVCAVSTSLIPFLIGRGLQGIGIGTIAVGISIMRDIVPPARLGSSVGTMSASLGVGGALGLPFSAIIAQHISWHALFWISAATALACGFAILAYVPESPSIAGGRFDAVGALGLAAVLTFILLPVSKGAAWGWSSPITVAGFVAFAIAVVLWWRYERRTANPLIDLDTLTSRPILLTNIASVATGFAFYAMQMAPIQILMAPEDAPAGLGMSMVQASLILMPTGLVMFGFSYVSAWLTRLRGARVSLATGGLVIGAGYIVFLVMLLGPWAIAWWWIIGSSGLVGAGLGIAYSAMPALIMQVVPVSQTGEANGVNALMRSVGTAAATAVVGMVLTASTVAVAGHHVPTVAAYTTTTAICISVCLVAFVTAIAIPKRTPLHIDEIV
ncbi:MFS transporter [Gordonia sp. PDNC005]|uniref:MFS transporter n=1 Tax=unclassified Gordonia (in: high G+C Gram-positive bacteria) TaxID=2657482 RepID=UPI001966AC05|nr:MFS transporter [Gordonia sp. PDNC005]QRY64240.1 MFS transporter [Gordonia sp. PDNC005]